MTHKNMKKRRIPAAAIICLAFAVILMIIAGGFAKYRTEMHRQSEMIAADFHISSDYLEAIEKSYEVSDWADGIDILLYNYEKENIRQIASEDITYTVKVEGSGFSCEVYDAQGNQISANTDGDYILPSNNRNRVEQTLKIVPNKNVTANEVKLIVEATAPFTKTLTATFKLTGTQQPVMEVTRITDNGDYYLATIRTGQYRGEITLTWNEALVPDNTIEEMRDWQKNNGSFQADTFTTYQLIFFNPQKAESHGLTMSAGE